MNDETRESIRKRDFYHKKKDMCNYRLWRNNVKYLVETSKQNYYCLGTGVRASGEFAHTYCTCQNCKIIGKVKMETTGM